jgi:hypothetical protein
LPLCHETDCAWHPEHQWQGDLGGNVKAYQKAKRQPEQSRETLYLEHHAKQQAKEQCDYSLHLLA